MRRILNPLRHYHLIGEVERVLQIVQSDHQTNGNPGATHARCVERSEALSGAVPVNAVSEFNQRVALINEVHELGSKELLLTLKLDAFGLRYFPRFRLPLILRITIQTPRSSSQR